MQEPGWRVRKGHTPPPIPWHQPRSTHPSPVIKLPIDLWKPCTAWLHPLTTQGLGTAHTGDTMCHQSLCHRSTMSLCASLDTGATWLQQEQDAHQCGHWHVVPSIMVPKMWSPASCSQQCGPQHQGPSDVVPSTWSPAYGPQHQGPSDVVPSIMVPTMWSPARGPQHHGPNDVVPSTWSW